MGEIALKVGNLGLAQEHGNVLQRAKQGDLDAFGQVMREHDRQIYRLALRLTGNPEDAKDAAQEVFLRLHRSLARIDQARGVGPWLYRVAVNVCNDLLRARRRMVAIDDVSLAGAAPDYETPERRRLLREAVARLPEKERAALVLRDIEGLSTTEVAEALGSSETTVRSQISSARSKLRQWLTGRRRS